MKTVIALVAVLALGACATGDRRSDSEIVGDLGVKQPEILAQYRCWHAIAPKGARSAAWEEAMCVRTKDRIIFGRFDKGSGRYIAGSMLPFSQVKSINLFKRALGRQIQLDTDAGIHMVGVKPAVNWVDIEIAGTEAEFAAMSKLGIPTGEATVAIARSNSSTFIPFFIPAKR